MDEEQYQQAYVDLLNNEDLLREISSKESPEVSLASHLVHDDEFRKKYGLIPPMDGLREIWYIARVFVYEHKSDLQRYKTK
jgi:hypothetical protein